MTLQDKIRLIDQFVKTEPDTTIKDYLAAVEEIENIERMELKREINTKLINNQPTVIRHIGKGFKTSTTVVFRGAIHK